MCSHFQRFGIRVLYILKVFELCDPMRLKLWSEVRGVSSQSGNHISTVISDRLQLNWEASSISINLPVIKGSTGGDNGFAHFCILHIVDHMFWTICNYSAFILLPELSVFTSRLDSSEAALIPFLIFATNYFDHFAFNLFQKSVTNRSSGLTTFKKRKS